MYFSNDELGKEMQLNYREYGDISNPSLFLLHGLFGSSVNWNRIAKELADDFFIIAPDLRNHGKSPHDDDVSYPSMAEDIYDLIDELSLSQVSMIGHSMGGKLAMHIALTHPKLVSRLVVVDIAPVTYQHDFAELFTPMKKLPLGQLQNRQEADEILTKAIKIQGIRNYLLQNLEKKWGAWRWRINLEGLSGGMPDIQDFVPVFDSVFAKETLFIKGENSDYINHSYYPMMQEMFPAYTVEEIPGAGHWVYSEKPAEFLHVVKRFLI